MLDLVQPALAGRRGLAERRQERRHKAGRAQGTSLFWAGMAVYVATRQESRDSLKVLENNGFVGQ
jgi:hypothetical protein